MTIATSPDAGFGIRRRRMFETVVGVATVVGVLIAAADFTLRWMRKAPPPGHGRKAE